MVEQVVPPATSSSHCFYLTPARARVTTGLQRTCNGCQRCSLLFVGQMGLELRGSFNFGLEVLAPRYPSRAG